MNVAVLVVSFLMLLCQGLRESIDAGKEVITLFYRMHMCMVLVFVSFETPVVDLGSGGTPLNGPICFLALEFATFIAKDYIQYSSGSQKPL